MLKEKYLKFKEQGIAQECLLVALCFTLLVWVLFVATPFDIVAANSEEFTFVPGISILWNGLFYALSALISLVVLYILASFTFKKYIRKFLFLTLIIAFSLSVWLNSTFLTGIYGEFNGRDNLQIAPFALLNWIQLSAFLIIFALAIYFRNRPKIFIYIIASIFLISFSVATINIASKLSEKKITQSSEEKFFTYSKNNPNLLFILLDEYQSDYFAEILDDKLKDNLNGFIWFKDASSNFPTTIVSIPAMFTGAIYDNNVDRLDFYKAISDHSIAKKFQGQVNYTFVPMSNDFFPDGSFTKFSELDTQHLTTYSGLINYSLFRAAPDIFKHHIYNNGNWSIHLSNTSPYDTLGDMGTSFKNLNYIANKKLIAAEGSSTFKFYYSGITHSPTVLGSKCEVLGKVSSTLQNKSAEGACAMSKMINVIKNLKQKNIFDNTMIIISADHGSVYKPASFYRNTPYRDIPYGGASPTLLIKPLYGNDLFQISDYPAQLSDIPKTIATAFNIPHEYSGVDLLSKSKQKNRSREFNKYIWTHEHWAKSRLPPITKYTIEGPLRDPQSWTIKKNISPIECEANLDFSKETQSQYYLETGIGQQEDWGRASDGPQAKFQFKTKPDCKTSAVSFNLRAFVTPKNPEQTAQVLINDKPVGNIAISTGEAQPKKFTFPLPTSPDNTYSVRFKIDKPTTPKSVGAGEDLRELGFGFVNMELLSNEAVQ